MASAPPITPDDQKNAMDATPPPEQPDRLPVPDLDVLTKDWTLKDWLKVAFGLVQTLVVVLMYVSIRHGTRQFELSRKQFESTIEPVVSIHSRGSDLIIRNDGIIPVSHIEVSGILRAAFSYAQIEPVMIHSVMDGLEILICDAPLVTGTRTNLSLVPLSDRNAETSVWKDTVKTDAEVLGIIICYRRDVDMKPFYKLFLVNMSLTGSPSDPLHFVAIDPSESITFGGGVGSPDYATAIRRNIEAKLDERKERYK